MLKLWNPTSLNVSRLHQNTVKTPTSRAVRAATISRKSIEKREIIGKVTKVDLDRVRGKFLYKGFHSITASHNLPHTIFE